MAKTIKSAKDTVDLIKKASLDKSKSVAIDDKKSTSKDPSKKDKDDQSTAAKVPKPEPLLDPHHFRLVLMGSKIKMEKYDKHPDPKDRRGKFKDMVTVEVAVECIQRIEDKMEPLNSQQDDEASREASKQSMRKKPLDKKPPKRKGTPEMVNINVHSTMGAN